MLHLLPQISTGGLTELSHGKGLMSVTPSQLKRTEIRLDFTLSKTKGNQINIYTPVKSGQIRRASTNRRTDRGLFEAPACAS